ncbi:MAG: HAMP domain-containing sensor histidine kinase [Eubacteriales bacterium]|nr:HAMP domain-containing sensor histidine kinase [Eubacteriales bacterium]
MIYLVFGIISVLAVYFFIRYKMLSRALERTDKELKEIIVAGLEENRILKKDVSSKELENLLITLNSLLGQIRSQRVLYQKREKEFQQQIENISHDLRTPLTAVMGYLKIMDKDSLNQEDRDNLDVVIGKTMLLKRLISQFYDFSRLTADDYILKTESVDIARLLRETLMGFYTELEEKELLVNAVIPDHPVWVVGDRDGAERVLVNLFQNVCRYGETIFSVELKAENGQVKISFINDVSGMKKEETEHMFQRFYVREPSRGDNATGLGLTIAQCLTEKMGGRLTADLEGEKRLKIELSLKEIK